ncbi:hypothetical protein HYH03_008292 [Edaphochlamys debaryana]|uniref:Serine/threonine-protein phosphatase 4 regulatory subunit 3-like central domain-containing protein n=1 Tax=Edaphochlamys debaryana TaxID=47281 RepID=A0A835Y6R3_9CHLO|nr:hypothetical protein HYH03_008292 [Edaphochlamys debaryana]|eukprot:KAG2493475.1 hypothetical protein HYH03_008292 [Edaphochlamys debaryana]
MHRVKVYKLNTEGQWEDKGTGHISVEYMEQARAMGLVVVSEEENGKTLLVHQISREDIYTRSETTIITWHDAEISTDVAISFQEQVGCDHIWNQIKQVQRDEHQRHQDHERGRKTAADEYDPPTPNVHLANGGDFLEGEMDLPAPERRNLEDIAKALSHVPPFQRDRIAAQLMKQNYLPALLDLFKQCEDLEDNEGLTHMYAIVRSAIMLNDSSVLEEMLREEHVMDVLGALEYDPDVKQPQKHRDFLQSHVQFKEVVPITNPQILAKIHQTYRIQYLKDVILPRSLDDATYATLSSLALFNNMEVVGALMADAAFLPQLFQRLQQTDPSDSQWHDLVAFLQEFCSLARHLQQQQRAGLFNRLIQLGLFEVVTRIMLHSSDEVKLKATDILMSSMQHDVLALREFLYKQPEHTLFGLLVRELTDGRDTGLAEQVCESIKLLMDPDTMEQPVEKNEFLEVFYDKYLEKLTEVIISDSSINPAGTRVVPATTLALILELLSFCVQNHSYRIRYYTLRNNLLEKVLRLLHRRERWLVCATVRFMRVCVALKDDFWTRYILRTNCFGPLMVVFFENGERYNLLNSAVLDLIDFIRRENIKPMLEHLVETYGPRFEELSYVETFRQLRLKYDQAPERAGSAGNGPAPRPDEEMADASGAAAAAGAGLRGRTFVFTAAGHHSRMAVQAHGRRRRRDDRDLEKDEEDYFSNEDADDEQEVFTRPHAHSMDLGQRGNGRGTRTGMGEGEGGEGVAMGAGPGPGAGDGRMAAAEGVGALGQGPAAQSAPPQPVLVAHDGGQAAQQMHHAQQAQHVQQAQQQVLTAPPPQEPQQQTAWSGALVDYPPDEEEGAAREAAVQPPEEAPRPQAPAQEQQHQQAEPAPEASPAAASDGPHDNGTSSTGPGASGGARADLGRRSRSEDGDEEVAREAGQDLRKRVRSEEPGPG